MIFVLPPNLEILATQESETSVNYSLAKEALISDVS